MQSDDHDTEDNVMHDEAYQMGANAAKIVMQGFTKTNMIAEALGKEVCFACNMLGFLDTFFAIIYDSLNTDDKEERERALKTMREEIIFSVNATITDDKPNEKTRYH